MEPLPEIVYISNETVIWSYLVTESSAHFIFAQWTLKTARLSIVSPYFGMKSLSIIHVAIQCIKVSETLD